MSNTTQVIAEKFIDAVTQNSYSITKTRNELRDEIDAAIAAAVQAEREACAKVADGIWHLLDVEGNDHDHVVTEPIAAAIRARNGAGRK